MNAFRSLKALSIFGALFTGACQTTDLESRAVLDSADGSAMSEIKSVLARAMNTARVEIGPGDLTRSSTISILPPRLGQYEDRSTAMPILFDLMIKGDNCYLVRRDSGDEFPLNGVDCRTLDN